MTIQDNPMLRITVMYFGEERVQQAFARALQAPRVSDATLEAGDKAAAGGITGMRSFLSTLSEAEADAFIIALATSSTPLREADTRAGRKKTSRRQKVHLELDDELIQELDQQANRLGLTRAGVTRLALGHGLRWVQSTVA